MYSTSYKEEILKVVVILARVVCASTGCFKYWTGDINERIALIAGSSAEGIELMFADALKLFSTEISKENLAYTRGLRHVSFHAPFDHFLGKDALSRKIIAKCEELCGRIGAEHIVFHPNRGLEPAMFAGFEQKVLFENTSPANEFGRAAQMKEFFREFYGARRILNGEKLKEFGTRGKQGAALGGERENEFEINEKHGVVLDLCHAYEHSPLAAHELVHGFRDDIKEVHISAATAQHWHLPPHEMSNVFRESIRDALGLKVPFVIEAQYEAGRNTLERDLEFVRCLLSKEGM